MQGCSITEMAKSSLANQIVQNIAPRFPASGILNMRNILSACDACHASLTVVSTARSRSSLSNPGAQTRCSISTSKDHGDRLPEAVTRMVSRRVFLPDAIASQ